MFGNFITQSGQTRAMWAERLGVSRSYLSDVVNGNRRPSLDLAVRIARLTGGAVPVESWVPDASAPVGDAEDAA